MMNYNTVDLLIKDLSTSGYVPQIVKHEACRMLEEQRDKIMKLEFKIDELNNKTHDRDKFVADFEKELPIPFNELENAINDLDLKDETKQYLSDLLTKDENILFGFVEEYFKELK